MTVKCFCSTKTNTPNTISPWGGALWMESKHQKDKGTCGWWSVCPSTTQLVSKGVPQINTHANTNVC